jgi:hypothetical protein
MTVIFEDEALYTALKVEAAREGRYVKDIVAEDRVRILGLEDYHGDYNRRLP